MRSSLSQQLLRHIQAQKFIRPGDRVGVAVSGGADSVALLLLLLELQEKLGIVLSVVHFNHKLRGKASDADEKFVAKLAAKHGVVFHVEHTDVAAKAKQEKTNLEEAARRARYSFFARLVEEGHMQRVAVAHTADDQGETVLAHILRGTGLAGLGGIHPIAGHDNRPFLIYRRTELRSYLRAKKQPWREDATNRDVTRMRARIRKKLLPLLEKQFHAAVVSHLSSLAELAREDEKFLDGLTTARCEALVTRAGGETRIGIANLLYPFDGKEFDTKGAENAEAVDRDTALTKRILRHLIEDTKRGSGQVTARHIAAVLELARQGQSGKSLQLPGGVEVRREANELTFCAQFPSNRKHASDKFVPREYEYKIELKGGQAIVQIPEQGCAFRLTVIDWPPKRGETKGTGAVLDRDRLHFPLLLRNWRPGDKLHPVGHQKAHKLKRLFNERRISRWERNGWPVLTSGGVLVWARRFPVAAGFAANEETRAGILIAEETYS